jgi:hypothetical protein
LNEEDLPLGNADDTINSQIEKEETLYKIVNKDSKNNIL